MLEKKTKRELALDFFQNFLDEGTSKDEAEVWVSQDSLIRLLNELSDCDEPHRIIDLIIKKLKGEKE